MVSGHPLDSLKRYCQRRSSNTKFLKTSFGKLKKLKNKDKEKYDNDIKSIVPQVI
jgi:hypothetical protein